MAIGVLRLDLDVGQRPQWHNCCTVCVILQPKSKKKEFGKVGNKNGKDKNKIGNYIYFIQRFLVFKLITRVTRFGIGFEVSDLVLRLVIWSWSSFIYCSSCSDMAGQAFLLSL